MEDFVDTDEPFVSNSFQQRFKKKDSFKYDLDFNLLSVGRSGKNILRSGTDSNLKESHHHQSTNQKTYNIISNDIWFHVSKYIQPEHVKTFALICSQTAALVKTKLFWKQIIKNYTDLQTIESRNVDLFHKLQTGVIRNITADTLRCCVIEALYLCHEPFRNTLKYGYPLDILIGRSYVSSWHKQTDSVWIMCYKFWNNMKIKKHTPPPTTLNSWETIANDNCSYQMKNGNPFEGVVILVIVCDGYIPFPTQLLYDNRHGARRPRLCAARQMLTKDIRSVNLELDFRDSIQNSITTVKYPCILKFDVVPWWHPKFKSYLSVEKNEF